MHSSYRSPIALMTQYTAEMHSPSTSGTKRMTEINQRCILTRGHITMQTMDSKHMRATLMCTVKLE